METLEYSQRDGNVSPSLFSLTNDFEFVGTEGRLMHRILAPGPKGFKVVSVVSTGHSASFVETDRTAVTLPQRGHADVQVGSRQFSVSPGDMVALGPSERQSRLSRDAASDIYESYTILSPANWPFGLPEDALYRSPDPKRLKLCELLRFSFAYLSDPELVSDRTILLHEALVEDALVETLTSENASEANALSSHRSEFLARSAQHYIDENFSEAITVAHVAQALEVSMKALQRSFRTRRGMTVRSYLARVRLDAMRRQLEKGGPDISVTSAALDSGLFHLGRSSSAYRDRFGELPSETLDRVSSSIKPRTPYGG
ncbi:AraC family transcriptional regulator [Sedimentitalea todarodis]|uniref:Helix-turn-helix domain-containing protein n=1 Tax=Sedimentitalea todarodis TaxID=1631240 RepID=A0ABU3VH22_9RHOB|nr:helix-turn-helix domain-containing protein [Sedimentitalea todarodis]MDU9005481.1 helix-turn-helix domain-containing protein [Sedimentitalea todarodis]